MAASLRIVTLNFWGTEEPLERRLDVAVRQLRELGPDVIAMQEVAPVGEGTETTADRIAACLGLRVTLVRARQGGVEGGLAVLTRQPARDSRLTRLPEERPGEARRLLSVLVETGAGPVFCHSTHLHWRLEDGLARERQVAAVDEAVQALGDGALHILCGDFNAVPESDEIRFLRGLTTLAGRRTYYQDAWALARPEEPGFTWSMQNPYQATSRTIAFDRRVDYIFVSPREKSGRGTVLGAEVVLAAEEEGAAASDHYGVLAEVQIAEGAAT